MNNLLMYLMVPIVFVPYLMLIKMAYVVIAKEDKVAEEWVNEGAKLDKYPAKLLAAPVVIKQIADVSHNEAA